MAKRRTRKQKAGTKHTALTHLYADPEARISLVKGEISKKNTAIQKANKPENKVVSLTNSINVSLVKRDIVKSLILASFILCLELVLYFFWK